MTRIKTNLGALNLRMEKHLLFQWIERCRISRNQLDQRLLKLTYKMSLSKRSKQIVTLIQKNPTHKRRKRKFIGASDVINYVIQRMRCTITFYPILGNDRINAISHRVEKAFLLVVHSR